ncbi:hypothetical protein RRG08_015270 [Elysia crispata]|uniref:Uncharacterized protein n=1 Tax=Elysia crispata TaxID=231223 RepID=A0AAE1AT93_9GAST|nr:hypothetical protein RRG08_015270 [Elysia crispata]
MPETFPSGRPSTTGLWTSPLGRETRTCPKETLGLCPDAGDACGVGAVNSRGMPRWLRYRPVRELREGEDPPQIDSPDESPVGGCQLLTEGRVGGKTTLASPRENPQTPPVTALLHEDLKTLPPGILVFETKMAKPPLHPPIKHRSGVVKPPKGGGPSFGRVCHPPSEATIVKDPPVEGKSEVSGDPSEEGSKLTPHVIRWLENQNLLEGCPCRGGKALNSTLPFPLKGGAKADGCPRKARVAGMLSNPSKEGFRGCQQVPTAPVRIRPPL